VFEVIGHRGAGSLEPENTLQSFKRAYDLGCRRVELDIHVTADNKAVIIHDGEYDGFPIKDYSLKDLKSVSSGRGTPVPELAELFELFSGKQLYFQIELKGEGSEDVVPELADIFGMAHMIRYTSFVHPRVKRALELTPDAEGGLLMCSVAADPCYLLEICGASYLHLSKDYISSSIVNELKDRGFGVIGWGGISGEKDFRFLVGSGASGATTDRPDLFLDFLNRYYNGSLNR